jgi:CHAT domain-containing protein
MKIQSTLGNFQASIFLVLSVVVFGCKTPSILVTEEQQKGDEYSNSYDYTNAIVHYKSSLSSSRQLGVYRNMEEEADICRKIAYAYNVQGDFQQARDYAYFAYRRDSAINNSLGIIEDYREIGKAYLYMGDFHQGISYLDTVIVLSSGLESSIKSTNQKSIADTYLMLAQVQSVLGKYEACLENANLSLDIYRKLNNDIGEMESSLVLGKVTYEISNPYQAEVQINTSMLIAKENQLNISRHLMALANIAEGKADYEQAIRYRRESIAEAKNAGIIPQEIWSTVKTGDAYALLGDDESAEKFYNEAMVLQDSMNTQSLSLQAASDARGGKASRALAYYSEIGSDVSKAITLMRMGDINMARKNYFFAVKQYEKAEEAFTLLDSKEGIARSNVMLAELFFIMNEKEKIDAALDKVRTNSKQPETLWRLHFISGKAFERAGQDGRAIESYEKAIQIIEDIRGNITIDELKSSFINDKIIVYDRLIELLMKQGKNEEALNISEKARARAFLDLIGNKKIDFRSDNNQNLVGLEQELRSEIQALTKLLHREDLGTGRGVNRSIIQENLRDTRSKYTDLMQQMKLHSNEFASIMSFEPLSLMELQKLATENSAFLSYWTGKNASYVWVIKKNEIISKRIESSESDLIALTRDIRNILPRTSDFKPGDFRSGSNLSIQTLKDAYKILIEPVIEDIEDVDIIGIIPHKVLHLLPFQSLMDSDNHFFAESKQVYYTPSLSTLAALKDRKTNVSEKMLAMALGDIDLLGFSGLPGTKLEVQNISSSNENIVTRYEENSTETYFKDVASSYGRIHLATHGYMDATQPLFSFVLFAPTDVDDGMLTVTEVFEMSLNSELVVLSACQTGLGALSKGDDIVGLSRAMLYAGTENVIVSLWSVADEHTALLMTEFYSYLKDYEPTEALQRAQKSIMKLYPSPFYWAPFQLVGTGFISN